MAAVLDIDWNRYVKDPTCLFTLGVALVPLIYVDGVWGFIRYLLWPMMLLSYVYLGLVLYSTHSTKCVKLSDRDFRVSCWFLMNGVYFNLFFDVVSGQFQMMDEMSRQYNNVEPRYVLGAFCDAGAPVFMTSMLELFFESPLSLLVYYGYHRQKSWRRIAEIAVSILHMAGVWYFYFPEIYMGFPHLGGWPATVSEFFSFHRFIFFWFGFWFCMFLWLVVPFKIMCTAWSELSDLVKQSETKKTS